METSTFLADLPISIKAYTCKKDDYYTIILNSKLSHQQNLKSYYHELKHINDGDYEKKTVGLIEIYAHEIKRE